MPCIALNATNAAVTAASPIANEATPAGFSMEIALAIPWNTVEIAVPIPLNADPIAFPSPEKAFLTAEPAVFAILAKPVNGLGIFGKVGLNLLNGLGILIPFNFMREEINNPIPPMSGANAPTLNFPRAFLMKSSAGCALAFNSLNFATTALTTLLTTLRNFSEFL